MYVQIIQKKSTWFVAVFLGPDMCAIKKFQYHLLFFLHFPLRVSSSLSVIFTVRETVNAVVENNSELFKVKLVGVFCRWWRFSGATMENVLKEQLKRDKDGKVLLTLKDMVSELPSFNFALWKVLATTIVQHHQLLTLCSMELRERMYLFRIVQFTNLNF